MDKKLKLSLLMLALIGAMVTSSCASGGAPAPVPTPTIEKTFPTPTSAPARTPTTAPTSTTAPVPTTVPQAPGAATPLPSTPTTVPPQAPAGAASPAPSTPTPAAAPAGGNVAAGQSIFSTNCNVCHPAGQGGVGPALVGITAKLSDADVLKTVRGGKGMMPPFGALSDQQLTDLLAYLKTLR